MNVLFIRTNSWDVPDVPGRIVSVITQQQTLHHFQV